uniref:Polyketide synthase n=1 Tax=Candidatus Entotheonella serta TaxID=1652106 RepID=A0A2P1AMB1_9BACT|nr:polyketide synthase [Candidatus Entotheonella serta]
MEAKDIAVIGVGALFPGASHHDLFWENLIAGIDSIQEIPISRWDIDAYYSPDFSEPGKSISKWGGLIQGIDQFDHQFFNISPREARNMDPQQRLLLQEAWHCVEDSGIALKTLQEKVTSVFVGVMAIDYHQHMAQSRQPVDSYACLGNYGSILANRLSFCLGLSGESKAIDAACASSLVAVHDARRSLQAGECDYAIAAGVSVICHPWKYISFSKSRMLSPSGRCKTFDKSADGYVPGEGVGVLLMQSLERAQEQKCHIYGVLKGSALNNNGLHGQRHADDRGRKKVSITAPSIDAQRRVITDALRSADIDPASVSYVEAHGTGTSLGDPIEIEALKQVFAVPGRTTPSCAIGSVKTNIGHLEAAAGVAGVIKVLLMMKHKMIPQVLHLNTVNPMIDLTDTSLYLSDQLHSWESEEGIQRRAGVSSFGFGGSNAHAIFEEYVDTRHTPQGTLQRTSGEHLFVLSAKSHSSLDGLLNDWVAFLNHPQRSAISLEDMCATLMTGRESFPFRFALSVTDKKALRSALISPPESAFGHAEMPSVLLRIGSVNAEQAEVIASWYRKHPGFREPFDACRRLAKMLCSEEAVRDWTAQFPKVLAEHEALYGFAAAYATARLLLDSGVQPRLICGEGIGHGVALCLSGLWTLSQGLRHAMRLIDQLDLSPQRLDYPIYDQIQGTTLSPYQPGRGYLQALLKNIQVRDDLFIRDLQKALLLHEHQYTFKNYLESWNPALKEIGLEIHQLIGLHAELQEDISKKFLVYIIVAYSLKQLYEKWDLVEHDASSDPFLNEFLDLIGDDVLTFKDVVTLIGNGWYTGKEDLFHGITARVIPVSSVKPYEYLQQYQFERFDHIRSWLEKIGDVPLETPIHEDDLLLTVGDEGDVSRLKIVSNSGHSLSFLTRGQKASHLTTGVKQLWLHGLNIDWQSFVDAGSFTKASLPGYSFDGSPFWIENSKSDSPFIQGEGIKAEPVQNSYYHFVWQASKHPTVLDRKPDVKNNEAILLFDSDASLAQLLREQWHAEIILIRPARAFDWKSWHGVEIDPDNENHYKLVYTALQQKNLRPVCAIFTWTLRESTSTGQSLLSHPEPWLSKGIYAVYHLLKSLSQSAHPPLSQLLFFFHGNEGQGNPLMEAVAGYGRSLKLTYPQMRFRSIQFETGSPDTSEVVTAVIREFSLLKGKERQEVDTEVLYRHGQRLIKTPVRLHLDAVAQAPWKQGGVYLITGGMGALGSIWARYLAERYQARLILTGRSVCQGDIGKSIRVFIKQLQQLGGDAVYLQADITEPHAVRQLIEQAYQAFGPVRGLIHAAGQMSAVSFAEKSLADFQQTLSAKIQGTLVLDRVLHESIEKQALDIVIYFSSAASTLGDFGQCDYAIGNRFLDGYGRFREGLRTQGQRQGRTVVVNWPLWREGGMHLDSGAEALYLSASGLDYLEAEQGLDALDRILVSPHTQVMVFAGDPANIDRNLGVNKVVDMQVDETFVASRIEADLQHLAAVLLQMQADEIALDDNLSAYGFDSIAIKEFADQLSQYYQLEISPIVFFAHASLRSLGAYFWEHFAADMKAFYAAEPSNQMPEARHAEAPERQVSQLARAEADQDIAIIGMSGVFPGSPDLATFWKHLSRGRDLVGEAPAGRWDWRVYDGDLMREHEAKKTAIKWGGFIENVDRFDADFFSISRREAEFMDPQHRLFLQCVWATIEDAGYATAALSGENIGVFVGVQFSDYQQLLKQAGERGAQILTGNAHSVLANRISYLLDVRGPSLAIDTACASSLVAVHQGVQAIRNGDCTAAIVGGVSLMLSPDTFLDINHLGVLSPDGRCKTFDRNANGYVRGEGVGSFLLKPLSRALQDRDSIHGIIRGSAVQHGGKANSLTAPNSEMQAALLLKAYEDAGIGLDTVSYIETHGTATELGDPVEIEGLKQAYRTYRQQTGAAASRTGACGLGSVKTNIGHLEPAAGIAGLAKVLLAMRHQTLPATLHFDSLNPYIDLSESPFYIVDEKTPWQRRLDEQGEEIPRRAGVSSFGFGGAIAHLVLEEYRVPQDTLENGDDDTSPYLIVLSAKNEARLKEVATNLYGHLIEAASVAPIKLRDLAYTLQVGRDALPQRLALVVDETAHLLDALAAYVQGEPDRGRWFAGTARRDRRPLTSLVEAGEAMIAMRIEKEALREFAQSWVQGASINWQQMYPVNKPRRQSLPTYPFAQQRYWFDTSANTKPQERYAVVAPIDNRSNIERIYYRREWAQTALLSPVSIETGDQAQFVLLFETNPQIGEVWQTQLEQHGLRCIRVCIGERFRLLEPHYYQLNPHQYDDYASLAQALRQNASWPRRVVHLWQSNEPDVNHDQHLSLQLERGFYSLCHFTRALMQHTFGDACDILYSYRAEAWQPEPACAAVSGFAHTLALEHPRFSCKTIEIPAFLSYRDARTIDLLLSELQGHALSDTTVRYQEQGTLQRWVQHFCEWQASPIEVVSKYPRPHGVYLITGASGSLGAQFARHIAAQVKATFVLCARSERTPACEQLINTLRTMGSEAVYIRSDLSHRDHVFKLLEEIQARFKALHGIVHSAGVISDALVFNKTHHQIAQVLAPKVYGTVYLDEATKDIPLDFWVLFSSTTAVTGNVGQSDYACANRFMDEFAVWREQLRGMKQRSGKTLAINWPYWRDGGMSMSEPGYQEWMERTGLQALPTSEGVAAWDDLLNAPSGHAYVVAYGFRELLSRMFARPQSAVAQPSADERATSSETLYEDTMSWLQHEIASVVKASPQDIDVDTAFHQFGLDSVMMRQTNVVLEKKLGALPKTLLLEYTTIRDLTDHLSTQYIRELNGVLGSAFLEQSPNGERQVRKRVGSENSMRNGIFSAEPIDSQALEQEQTNNLEEIAIVGLSGRYPQAEDLNEFWENLKAGKSAIADIPDSRWDYRAYYDADPDQASRGKMYCSQGGFLNDIDQFDPLFFNITPLEAKSMPPEERLMLETVWSTLEDAGYAGEHMRSQKVGVFVGVTSNTYPLECDHSDGVRYQSPIDTSYFNIPNRISYFFNFTGPSIAIDTACSSSLVAIHMACESLRHGECEMAIAGGVNLYLHPSKYILMCQKRLLSTKISTGMFEEGGDGFIPGEGVGAVVLKPLTQAVRDRDNIYGVIKASSVFHKGRSNGYLLPSPESQTELLRQTLQQAKIAPETINYIEVQALGSEMVDQVEWRSLIQAYGAKGKSDEYKPHCGLGSLKPNIGHLEAASGIAQLSKVLLQMKHCQFLPSNVSDRRDPILDASINHPDSPFYFQGEWRAWERVSRQRDDTVGLTGQPRRAGINSFGAGGVNAHVIVEEYISPVESSHAPRLEEESAALIVVSSKTQQQLRQALVRLRAYLLREANRVDGPSDRVSLADIAFTLQQGREAFAERWAMVAKSKAQLLESLTRFLDDKTVHAPLFVGRVPSTNHENHVFMTHDRIEALWHSHQLEKLAQLWIQGQNISWEHLSYRYSPRRVSLPTYPFEKRHCWWGTSDDKDPVEVTAQSMPDLISQKTHETRVNMSDIGQVVADYYDQVTESLKQKIGSQEVYLLFAPFQERVEGFSWLKMFFEPEKHREHFELTLQKQHELKSMLYRLVEFANVHRIFDIGCGYATDLIQLAKRHPQVRGWGFSISLKQVEFGQQRIQDEGLGERVQLSCNDSTKDPLPGLFDLIIGFEVVVHIADKQGVFGNMARHLSNNGTIVLADCVANTVTSINTSHIGQYTSTAEEYSDILAQNSLAIVDCVDVGPEISNFLYDPNYLENAAYLSSIYPEMVNIEKEHQGWSNFGKVLEVNLVRYVLLTIRKATASQTYDHLLQINLERLGSGALSYAEALQAYPHIEQIVIEQIAETKSPDSHATTTSVADIEQTIVELAAQVLEMMPDEVNTQARFIDFGVDSLRGLILLDAVNRRLGLTLQIPVLFDHSSIHELSIYIASQLPYSPQAVVSAPAASVPVASPAVAVSSVRSVASSHTAHSDIAVIGMSGRFPGAPDLHTFWQNLEQGIDSISEVPPTRWELTQYYDADRRLPNHSYSKWGGFLDDVDQFDPKFFNISPAEAELMDPQQRLFLQTSWNALEDAGYAGQTLDGMKCGVYVGVLNHAYDILIDRANISQHRAYALLGNSSSILAARIAYLLNLKGPAVTLDTACSSSLVALHWACKSLRDNEVDMMLAGGVTLYLGEREYIETSQAGMLSPTGKCRAFSQEADGITLAEGVGVVVLKRLDKALQDRDAIYGVIKGTGINQDGKTNGITAPSAKSQYELQTEVYTRYGIRPERISYVEAHGTGTKLGDPIEVEALTQSFRQYTQKQNYCAIGSVKSNIGHTSAAAGIAGLIKVLLSLQHHSIPPTLHVEHKNEHINFRDSPFYVNTQLRPWTHEDDLPRQAAVSSFGFSGTNCHVVVEEPPARIVHQHIASALDAPVLMVLSAANQDRLRDYVALMIRYLEARKTRQHTRKAWPSDSLTDIAYTLQTGRTPLEQRLAMVVASEDEWLDKLRRYERGENVIDACYEGQANAEPAKLDLLIEGEEGRAFIESIVRRKNLSKLAQLWVGGTDIDWTLLYHRPSSDAAVLPQRISLPGYPFARESYWLAAPTLAASSLVVERLPRQDDICFKTVLSGDVFFLRDHCIDRQKVLPGVVYLEMARKAATSFRPDAPQPVLKNVFWLRPLMVNATDVVAYTRLKQQAQRIDFEISTLDEQNNRVLHAQGQLHDPEPVTPQHPDWPSFDLRLIQERCPRTLEGEAFFQAIQAQGFRTGPSFQVVRKAWYNQTEALCELGLPALREADFQDYLLHPSLVNAALESVILLIAKDPSASDAPHLPYTLGTWASDDTVWPTSLYAYARLTAPQPETEALTAATTVQRYEINLLDRSGRLIARGKDFCVRALRSSGETRPASSAAQYPVKYYYPRWEACENERVAANIVAERSWLVFETENSLWHALDEKLRALGVTCIQVRPGYRFQVLEKGRYEIHPERAGDYQKLVAELKRNHAIPERIIHAWSEEQWCDNAELDPRSLAWGFYSVFYLSQALISCWQDTPLHLLYLYRQDQDSPQAHYTAVRGFAQSLTHERLDWHWKTLALPTTLPQAQVANMLWDELRYANQLEREIRYDANRQRWVRRWHADEGTPGQGQAAPDTSLLRQQGVYLITGGGGGLGLLLGEYLAREYQAKVILVGRAEGTEAQQAKIDSWKRWGGEALYLQGDISRREDVDHVMAQLRSRFPVLHGVFHAAGLTRDASLVNKTVRDIDEVLAAKVYGTIYLDQATRSEELDFFVLFSSLSGVVGNIGQSDYAYANSFLDHFAERREAQRSMQKRFGLTVAIDWPLWRHGTMQVDVTTEKFLARSIGMQALETDDGWMALQHALAGSKSQLLVLCGDQGRFSQALGVQQHHTVAERAESPSENLSETSSFDLLTHLQIDLRSIMAAVLKLSPQEIEWEREMSSFGFDSISFVALANELNDTFELDLLPAVFFECLNAGDLLKHLHHHHRDALFAYYRRRVPEPAAQEVLGTPGQANVEGPVHVRQLEKPSGLNHHAGTEPIAIVGMSAVMPQSPDLETFWQHLAAGQDLITEIPKDRWDWQNAGGDTTIRWGGFMPDIDQFDALFFGISPREADLMDPQQRLLLQTVWKTIEHAGYKASDLSGSDTGVFVGVANSDYRELIHAAWPGIEAQSSTGTFSSILANRVSYIFNFTGPSEPIDTACSSSLVALHHALNALSRGECSSAIVGGVNALLTPTLHITSNKTGMLSHDGRCKTFDQAANGYVRGEGVAALLLKPLSLAKAQGDEIYALIQGSNVNHGGHATSLTTPNPRAQSELLIHAYEDAGIDPTTVTYIETHGTGTSLGDPIEISGLKQAFATLYERFGHVADASAYHRCGLGSVKTNVGHLEAAAGMAGLLKVVLAMQHKTLPAHLHFHNLNPYIDLSSSPFYITRQTCSWDALQDAAGKALPRRAGVSSFGFGGVNAHVIVEEYVEDRHEDR